MQLRDERAGARPDERGRRFAAVTARASAALPLGLGRVVGPRAVGYVLINGTTFVLDLSLLSLLHGGLGVALPLAIASAYVVAFGASFVANRVLNFRSHAAVGPQLRRYVAVVALNFLVFVLGLVDLLAAAGVEYQLARVLGGACETAFLYLALQRVVFPDTRTSPGGAPD